MSFPVIQSLLMSNELGKEEIACIMSYLKYGHIFHLYSYNSISNIPNNVILKDANEIIPQSELFIDSDFGYSSFINLFCYTSLFKKGGWWVDLHTICLRQFALKEKFIFTSEYCFKNKRFKISNKFIKATSNSNLFKSCIEYINNKKKLGDSHSCEFGSDLFSKMIFENNLNNYISDTYRFTNLLGNKNTYGVYIKEYLNFNPKIECQFNMFNSDYFLSNYYIYRNRYLYNSINICNMNLDNNTGKIDLKDVTFLLPVKITSPEDQRNLKMVVEYLMKSFNTYIIILETDTSRKVTITANNEIKYRFVFSSIGFKPNIKANKILRLIKTPILSIWEFNSIVSPFSIIDTCSQLRNYNVSLGFPYSNKIYFCDDIITYLFKKTINYSIFLTNNLKIDYRNDKYIEGGIIFIRTNYLNSYLNSFIYKSIMNKRNILINLQREGVKIFCHSGNLYKLWNSNYTNIKISLK
jgi:hypothetical protein